MKELIEFNLKEMELAYGIKVTTVKLIMIVPFLTVLIVTLILMFPGTRKLGLAMLRENGLIELLTFLFLFIGGLKGILLVRHLKKTFLNKYEVIFYMIFSCCLLIVAMEEIAWGQWFLKFDTPEFWEKINMQGETTLHNIKGMQGHNVVLRLIFGLGGMVGIFLSFYKPFQKIRAPFILLPYLTIVITLICIDIYIKFHPVHTYIEQGNHAMTEVSEMFIGIIAFLYIWLNEKRILIKFGRRLK